MAHRQTVVTDVWKLEKPATANFANSVKAVIWVWVKFMMRERSSRMGSSGFKDTAWEPATIPDELLGQLRAQEEAPAHSNHLHFKTGKTHRTKQTAPFFGFFFVLVWLFLFFFFFVVCVVFFFWFTFVDMGQNFAGGFACICKGPAGTASKCVR